MVEHLDAKLRSIEAQIEIIRANLKKKPSKKNMRLSELKGILKGKADFSEEDIEEAKLRFKESL